ncbi:MAG: hypothetical protein ABIF10_06255 [Candidatus Woesearchaeota archaeon]
MDSKVEMYVKRARTEIDSAKVLYEVSTKVQIKEILGLDEDLTCYSGVISHSYYAIFYCAKAMIESRNIQTIAPEIHKKTFNEFKKQFIDTGLLDASLLVIYKELIIRAETLLAIYREEKRKRGQFTYNTIPQANKDPAEQSIRNARTFFKHCSSYLSK